MRLVEPTAQAILDAVDLLRGGELVALPTETVYGLGADALNPDAVRKIFAAKGRPADHPLIVHLPDAEHLSRWAARIPKEAIALAAAFWPGPLTLILARGENVPDEVTGGQDTVGVRVPAHPVALALLRAFDSGIAAPSANRFGRISPTTAAHVREELGDRVPMVLDGGHCDVGIESTILDLSGNVPTILRPGAISADEIAAVIGRHPVRRDEVPRDGTDSVPRVSGSLAAHYAPGTPLRLVSPEQLHDAASVLVEAGRVVAVLARTHPDPHDPRLVWLHAAADVRDYAHDLYAALRRLDTAGADCILVEALPASPEWLAVTDRLRRAATGSGAFDET